MGLSVTRGHDGTAWHTLEDDDPRRLPLRVNVFDSDLAGVWCASAVGSTELFVGFTPSTYFEDDEAPGADSDDVQAGVEVFRAFLIEHTGSAPDAERLRGFFATDDDDSPYTFVEEGLTELFDLVGLPGVLDDV